MDRSICVTIILTKNKIISTNAGDSSVIMGLYMDLSHAQKPNNPSKKKESYPTCFKTFF